MTATTMTTAPLPQPRKQPASSVPLRGVLGSEWTKLRSVRSTYWTLAATVGAMVGLGLLISSAIMSRWDRLGDGRHLNFEPGLASLRGFFVAQLAMGVLGALTITAEHATGSIRNTFAATPQRRTVLLCKAAVFGGVALVVSLIGSVAAFSAGQAVFTQHQAGISVFSGTGARIAICGGLYLAGIGLFALGIGSLIRHTAGAIATLFGIVLVLPALVSALPTPWNDDVGKYLPMNAGEAMLHIHHGTDLLSPLSGGLILLAYVVVTLAVATVAVDLRDA